MVQSRHIKSANRVGNTFFAVSVILTLSLFSSCGEKSAPKQSSMFGNSETSLYDDALQQTSSDESLAAEAKVSGAIIELGDTLLDMGDVKKGADSKKKEEIRVYNRGNEHLVLQEVVAYCACTEAEWTREPIEPDDYGVIEVTVDADLVQGRHFIKNLQVLSNAKNGAKTFKVKGNILY